MNEAPSRLDVKDVRRQQLIDSTIACIARHGFAATTLARVAAHARLSRGIVGFYFKSKDALLLATLRSLAAEYSGFWRQAVAGAGRSPVDRLDAMIEAEFDPRISRRDKVTVWDAFWAEGRSRRAYQRLFADLDREYVEAVRGLCERIIEAGGYADVSAETAARGLTAMMNGLWHDLTISPKAFDRAAAKRTCRTFLAGLFPAEFGPRLAAAEKPAPARRTPARDRAGGARGAGARYSVETLPAWTYDSAEFYALEKEHIFRRTWHLVGHVSELAAPGDYAALDVAGERALVVCGDDGALRAFHNVCPHRASRLVADETGRCARAIVCPYHGWTFALDGRLRAVPAQRAFRGLEKARFGLKALEVEVWEGFVFVRFAGAGPTVAEMMAPYAAELAPFRMAEMMPLGGHWHRRLEADWKNAMDNYLEGYHIPRGHPGLYRMFGNNYEVEVKASGVGRAFSWMRDKPSSNWSERHYQRLLPEVAHLPEGWRRAWVYYNIFPSTTLNVFPDHVSYFQIFPAGPGRTALRARAYGLADGRREMRAARYLNGRINDRVQLEDETLIDWVQGGLRSSAYGAGLLCDKEICLRQFHDAIRAALPVARAPEPPPAGRIAEANRALARA